MHTFRSKALSLLAVVLLMVATASPALASMTCLMSGNTVLGWGQVEDCNPGKDDGRATVAATCCQFDMARPQHADFTTVKDMVLPLPVAIAVPWPVLLPAPLHIGGTESVSLRGPPDQPGSQCLAATGVFRI
ncbi:MAG: hypothetical protein J5I62_08295 [Flavobacteriales bacterium]|nr:hypothetical protein [Flavobacteriales bacterium]MEB2340383.1 hypothetical protein [Flavobacteriia bacterium]